MEPPPQSVSTQTAAQLGKPGPGGKGSFDNKFPDCVFLDLLWGTARRNYVDLLIELIFNEQRVPFLSGSIKFGVRGGELRLKITNGLMPLDGRSFHNALDPYVEAKRAVETEAASQAEKRDTAGLAIGGDSVLSGKADIEDKISTRDAITLSDEFDFKRYQITIKGSPDAPGWSFAVKTGEATLIGSLRRQKLGSVELRDRPCEIAATFEVPNSQFWITDVEGPFLPNALSENKRGVVKALVLRWLRRELGEIMSQGVLLYA